MFRTPFWQQLLVVWTVAALLVAILMALDRWVGGPLKFFWLIPYPSSFASVCAAARSFLGVRPLLATALVVPPLALVMTVALLVVRLVRLAYG